MADNLPARRTSASRFPAERDNRPVYARITDQPPPRTQYVYVKDAGGNSGGGGSYRRRTDISDDSGRKRPIINIREHKQQNVRQPLPKWIGNQRVVGYMWIIAMIFIGFDEWHNNGILPRPARLWYTSAVYGILALVGTLDPLIAIANALAIGYTAVLIQQYFSGSGQFAKG